MKLKRLLSERGITQTELARILGRDKSVVTNLFHGRRQLKAGEATLIARLLSVPVAEVLDMQEDVPGVSEHTLIPFQNAPGNIRGIKQISQREGIYYIEESRFFSDKAFALEIKDDALNLAGVLPRDIVISELDKPCKPGQFVVAQVYEGKGAETVVRRLQPPYLMPHSTNPAYQPIHVEQSDVRLVSPVLKLVRLF